MRIEIKKRKPVEKLEKMVRRYALYYPQGKRRYLKGVKEKREWEIPLIIKDWEGKGGLMGD
ncbi:MAG: hypothetical protein ABIK97_02080 [candidate division WOR-3 bacterium]